MKNYLPVNLHSALFLRCVFLKTKNRYVKKKLCFFIQSARDAAAKAAKEAAGPAIVKYADIMSSKDVTKTIAFSQVHSFGIGIYIIVPSRK